MADADETWLTGPEAEPYLAEAAASTVDELAVITRLRKQITVERARLVVEQTMLRRRARGKFALADRMFFTPIGLEQATDEATAAYKAARFPSGAAVIDFCCGIGGDLLSLGRRGAAVGIDRDVVTASRAAANCRTYAAIDGPAFRANVESVEVDPHRVGDCAAWHIDPDRRATGRRTTHIAGHEPGLATLEAMLAANPHGAIKLAPATELPPDWSERCTAEWISRRGECKQLVAWFGDLRSGDLRRATAVADDGTAQSVAGRPSLPVPSAEPLGRFLYDPDAAVLAADLLGAFAEQYQIAAVYPGSVYLTGGLPHSTGLLQTWEVLDEMPFDLRRVRGWLHERGIGRIEIKKRGLDVDPEKLRRDLVLSGDAAVGLILVRRGDRVSAVFAQRWIPS